MDADLLVHVVDGSDADPLGQIAAVHEVLNDVGAGDRAEQLVVNKIDRADEDVLRVLASQFPDAIFVSARTGQGLDELRAVIERRLPTPQSEVSVLLPWDRGDLLDRIHREGELVNLEHRANGTLVQARVHSDLAGHLSAYEQVTGSEQ